MISMPYTIETISNGATAVDGWSCIQDRLGTLEEVMKDLKEEIESAPTAYIKIFTGTGLKIEVNAPQETYAVSNYHL